MRTAKDVIDKIQEHIEDALYVDDVKEKQYYIYQVLKLLESPDYIICCDLGEYGKGKKPK